VEAIMREAHCGIIEGHFEIIVMSWKILHAKLWWPLDYYNIKICFLTIFSKLVVLRNFQEINNSNVIKFLVITI